MVPYLYRLTSYINLKWNSVIISLTSAYRPESKKETLKQTVSDRRSDLNSIKAHYEEMKFLEYFFRATE